MNTGLSPTRSEAWAALDELMPTASQMKDSSGAKPRQHNSNLVDQPLSSAPKAEGTPALASSGAQPRGAGQSGPDGAFSMTQTSEARKVERLHAAKEVDKVMLTEKAWHRTCAYLTAQGHTMRFIAQALDKSEQQVGNVSRQPWFRDQVAKMIDDFGLIDESAMAQMRAAASLASSKIVEKLSCGNNAIELKAAMTIHDRVLGRPMQTIHTERHTVPQDIDEEIARLEADILRNQNPNYSTITS